jgi:hypothetical protein
MDADGRALDADPDPDPPTKLNPDHNTGNQHLGNVFLAVVNRLGRMCDPVGTVQCYS